MIYVHIPYCHRKCTYCAFYSAVTSTDKQAYVDALCKELMVRRGEMSHPLRTIYFGGGTPTLMSVSQLSQIVDTLRRHYDTHALEEVTIEANPEDLTPNYLQQLTALNFFNRISIGVQSFDDQDLLILNRRHTARQSVEAIQLAHQAGFRNISIDLIYGLPGQTLGKWQQQLDYLNGFPITHLSAYALTIEEGTMLHRQVQQGKIIPADEDTVVEQYQALLTTTRALGIHQYEVSNFCREGMQSRHNSRYWDRTPYLGVGASAHSFDGTHRRWNIANASQYIAAVNEGGIYHESETLTPSDAYNEYLMTALRTTRGIDKSMISPTYSSTLAKNIQPYIKAGLIIETPTHYRPTPEGLLHADGIAAELFV